jgi:3'-phosphoadenosine 5'-phosphosulfate sulfotransferase (PAPS reductase)/FAD synthetase
MPLDGFTGKKQTDQPITVESFYGENKPFLIVSYGLGRDSTAMLIKLAQLGIRPEIIIHADTGAEKDSTYAYLPIMNAYLRSIGFPEITIVKLHRNRDRNFETHLFRLGIFGSLTYGSHKCSATWKIDAIEAHLKTRRDVREAKRQGRTIVRAIGFEAGEEYRASRQEKKKKEQQENSCKNGGAFTLNHDSEYATWLPLIELAIDFDSVLDTIWREGLPIPPKSSCYFCAGMRQIEVYQLSQTEPHKFFRALVLERLAQRNRIVPHVGRVQGIAFGKKWSDYECADPYIEKIEEAIQFFRLDREYADGDKSRHATGWKLKKARVELFIECFKTPERLFSFMSGETDLSAYAAQIEEINQMPGVQMALPI